MNKRFAVLLFAAFAVCALPASAADLCASLKSAQLPDTSITLAEHSESKLLPPYGSPLSKLPAFCRVAGVLHPTSDSQIKFEVWMPEQGWNGRLLGTGNGGFAGSIYYDQMANMLRQGYAVTGSDAGHEAEGEDGAFSYHHPEKVKDFGWRAVHLNVLRAKEILTAYYGHPQNKAYFDGCSDGGREALMEAQRFPEDYDGILAGAPANNWAHMLSSGIDVLQTTLRDPAGYISSYKLPAITRATLAACDAQDGVKDGVISDPQSCHFDPKVLLCKDGDNLQCLTAPQVTTLTKLYTGGVDSHGKSIFPGFAPGDEAASWRSWVVGSGPGGGGGPQYAQNYFRYMVTGDPGWSVMSASVDESLRNAVAATGETLDSTDPDLSRFAARGGKLIVYHGWNDPAISPYNAIGYWQSVQTAMGPEKADGVMQLYMVPGMEHCLGGPGPNSFGQLSLPAAAGLGTGALDVLEAWVEKAEAPQTILALKAAAVTAPESDSKPVRRHAGGTRSGVVTTSRKATAKPVATAGNMVRPLCPYPQQARYDGTGNPNLAASFHCGK